MSADDMPWWNEHRGLRKILERAHRTLDKYPDDFDGNDEEIEELRDALECVTWIAQDTLDGVKQEYVQAPQSEED